VIARAIDAGLLAAALAHAACVVPRSGKLDYRAELPKAVRAYYVEEKIVVEVEVDGKGPYGFLLDTGASICSLDPWLDKELDGTRDGRSTSYGVAGAVAHDLVRAHTLDMGPVRVERPVFTVLTEGSDAGELWMLHRIGARGVLGMEVVAPFVLVLNASLPSVEILREAPALDAPALPLSEGPLGLYQMRLEVGEVSLDVVLDTGDVAGISVSASKASDLGFDAAGTGSSLVFGVGGTVSLKKYGSRYVKVGEKGAMAAFGEASPHFHHSAVVGMQFLKHWKWTFDFRRGLAWAQ
jgi:hypothetical protein